MVFQTGGVKSSWKVLRWEERRRGEYSIANGAVEQKFKNAESLRYRYLVFICVLPERLEATVPVYVIVKMHCYNR